MLGGSVTQFPICPACGNEGRVHGTADWNCGRCRAMIGWESETNEAGEDISHWVVRIPPREGVLEALERGEDPFVWQPPNLDPHGHAKNLIQQRQAILSDSESITLGDLAKELGASCQELVKLGRAMGLFAKDKGGPRTQLTYDQFTKLQHMWAVGGVGLHQESKWQTGEGEEPEVEESEFVEAEA